MSQFASGLTVEDIMGQDTGVDPRNDPRRKPPTVPSSYDIPSLDRTIRKDADKIAKWTLEHLRHSRQQREYLERLWIRVESYMEGFHFFDIEPLTGRWIPKPAKPNEIRATVPLIRSLYRRELGRFSENLLTVQGYARSPNNPMAFYEAKRAEIMVNAWQEEIDFSEIFTDYAIDMLYYGRAFLYRWSDPFRRQVYAESWPAWEIHPLPWNVTRDCELQGFIHCKQMPREWIEQNFGKAAARKASYNGTVGPRVGGSPMGNAIGGSFASKGHEAAEVCWVWLLPTREIPSGQKYVLVGDEMFGFQATDEQGRPVTGALAKGKFPGEFCQYTKQRGNWYGMGALAPALGAQAEADRQWSKTARSARVRDGRVLYRQGVIDSNDLYADDNEYIPVDDSSYGQIEDWVKVIPPLGATGDVGASLAIAQELGRVAAGHESDIIRGQAEGRVESGPLGNILNVNARAPLAPTMQSLDRALHNTYQGVLDEIGQVWPEGKRISVIGLYMLPQEMTLSKTPPTSENVILRPSPLMPGGRSEMMNLLFGLRNARGDNQQPEITSAEFRRSLAAMGMSPPGIEIASPVDQRIRQRLSELFNDGRTPGRFFTDEADMAMLMLEDPRMMRDALVNMILDPGFRASASRQVKAAFLQVLKEVRRMALVGDGRTGDRYDENLDLEAHDAQRSEEFMDALEQNPETPEGQFMPGGVAPALYG